MSGIVCVNKGSINLKKSGAVSTVTTPIRSLNLLSNSGDVGSGNFSKYEVGSNKA